MDSQEKSQKLTRVLRWTARVWSIPAILFAGGHLLFPESNGGGEVFWDEWLALGAMFASVFALLLAWWKEKIGGWASLGLLAIALIIYAIYRQEFFPIQGLVVLLVGIVIPAALFLTADRMRMAQTS